MTDCRKPLLAAKAAVLLLALGAASVLPFAGRAEAHGSASWIMESMDFGWCCGPKDCFWLEAKEVRVDGDNYVVDQFDIRWPIFGSFVSVNHHYWACYYMDGSEKAKVKCFFAPPRTM